MLTRRRNGNGDGFFSALTNNVGTMCQFLKLQNSSDPIFRWSHQYPLPTEVKGRRPRVRLPFSFSLQLPTATLEC
jgi:hypothetical protein